MLIRHAIALHNALQAVREPSGHPEFAFACALNASRLEPVARAASAAQAELLRGHARRGRDGVPFTTQAGEVEVADPAAFDAALTALLDRNEMVDLRKVGFASGALGTLLDKIRLPPAHGAGLLHMIDLTD